MRSTPHAPRSCTRLALVLLAIAFALPAAPPEASTALPPTVRHAHDVHRPHPLPNPGGNDVQAIAVDASGIPWVATADGAYRLGQATRTWERLDPIASATPTPTPTRNPCFDIAVIGPDEAWVAAWDGLYHWHRGGWHRGPGAHEPVARIALDPRGALHLAGPGGFHRLVPDGAGLEPTPVVANRQVADFAFGPDGAAWLATGMGLHRWHPGVGGPGKAVRGPFETASLAARAVAFEGPDTVWAATLGGLQRFEKGRFRGTLTARDGLPSSDVRAVAMAPAGALWVGTDRGIARKIPRGWSVRTGRRWLVHDEVRAIAFASDGTAWIATAGGVSELRVQSLSLAEKARAFHGVLEARHVRPPGIVEKCRLRVPGDLTTWGPEDDDNDGGYTALALAMESFRYAATGDPAALLAARRALAACEFLQSVTGTPGLLARTVVPSDWTEMHDPNLELSPPDIARERVSDPRNKYVPVRWRRSSDGRWLWKGDTSSDEMTAHFFGYFAGYQRLPDPSDRARIRAQVVRLSDHLLQQGLVLRDQDGQPTRWGVWAPDRLNDDPDWAMERGINSTEILSFLKLAHAVSGEPRFEAAYRSLIRDHHYDRNVLEAPNLNPAWRTYIDFELLAFAYPALLTFEKDPRLAALYRRGFDQWHRAVRSDGNPFFEFLHAAYGSRRSAQLDAARRFLIDTPLDLVRWDVDLRGREDVIVRRGPEVEHLQLTRLLPASEIGYSRTDQNPWRSWQGDGGRTESDGVFWLLPYWMGRCHGFVAP